MEGVMSASGAFGNSLRCARTSEPCRLPANASNEWPSASHPSPPSDDGLRGRLNWLPGWLPPGWFWLGWILEWFTQESTLDEVLHLVTNCFKAQ